MLLQTASSFLILVCHSWPARTKLHRWSRRLWRSTTCSIWTAGTSLSCSSSLREEVGSQSHCPVATVVRKTWKRVCSLVNCALLFSRLAHTRQGQRFLCHVHDSKLWLCFAPDSQRPEEAADGRVQPRTIHQVAAGLLRFYQLSFSVLCFQFVNPFKFQPWNCHRISNCIYNREALYEAGKKAHLKRRLT